MSYEIGSNHYPHMCHKPKEDMTLDIAQFCVRFAIALLTDAISKILRHVAVPVTQIVHSGAENERLELQS